MSIDSILAALRDPSRTDGSILISLKGATAATGATPEGTRPPIEVRLAAEAAIRAAFPQLGVEAGVEHVVKTVENGQVVSKMRYRTFLHVRGVASRELLSALFDHPNVDFVHPNWTNLVIRGAAAAALMISADAASWAIDTMRARQAWALGYRGAGVSVNMVDTGIDGGPGATHPDVKSTSGTMIYNATWGKHSDNACTVAYSACWYEAVRHGTGVYGVQGAFENDSAAVGIAPAAPPWVAVGIPVYVTTSGAVVGDEADYIDAVNQVTAYHSGGRRVGVVSIGYATEDTVAHREMLLAFRNSAATGVLWFAASEEVVPNMVGLPGVFPEVVAVGAVHRNLTRLVLPDLASPVHPELEFVAPGEELTSSWNRTDPGYSLGFRTDLYGTSNAAPAVAGAARLAWEANPSWSVATLRQKMQLHARDLGASGRDNTYGYGLPDAICLIREESPCDPLSMIGYIEGPTVIDNPGTYRWDAIFISGGTGTPSYRWDYRPSGGSYAQVGTAQYYTRSVASGDPSFELRLTITSGSRSTTNTMFVQNNIPPGCDPTVIICE